MSSVFISWVTTVLCLAAFGVTGLAATAILLERHATWMCAPFAGVLIWPTTTLALYVGLPISFDAAAITAFVVLGAMGIVLTSLRASSWRGLTASGVLVIAACALVGPVVLAASIQRGEPAILYVDGADHFGYAALADWMRSNPPQALSADASGVAVIGPAVADPNLPYRSYPNLMLSIEGRGGAYAYVAIVSILTSRSGAFSYDPAMAIALLAACLGCAAVFSRSLFVAAVFSVALLTSHWYDYGHCGFLGKLIAYPAIIFIFGLVVRFCKAEISPPGFLAIFILAAGASLAHNGQAFALLYGVIAVPFFAGLVLFGQPYRKLFDLATLVAMPAVAAVVASGTLARPFRSANAYPHFNFDWSHIVIVLADLNNIFKDVSPLSGAGLWTIWIALLAICIALAAYAVARRDAAALALIVGPTMLVGALGLFGAKAVAVQLVGLPYPAMLCGAMLLAQETGIGGCRIPITTSKEFLTTPPSRRRHYFTNAIRYYISPAALAIALVATHVPRLVGSVQHYAFNSDFRQRLAMSDFDRLAHAVGGQQLYVDIKGSLWSVFPVVIELGRRDMHLVWAPEAWKTAIGALRGWPPPAVEHVPSLRLIDVTEPAGPQERILIETPRYKLLARVDAAPESR